MSNVLVIGGLHHNTLGVIRSLGEEGIPSCNIRLLIVGMNISEKNILSMSKYVTNENIDYVNTDECIVPYMLRLQGDKTKRCVICCSDGSAEAVISNYDVLKKYYDLPRTKIDIHQLMKKQFQDQIAIECGFTVPYSKIINKGEEYSWSIFPCIIKPLKSVYGNGKADIIISHNKVELDEALLSIGGTSIQIQQYIKKEMEYQLIGCSLDSGKNVIIPGYTNIIRQPHNTNTGYLFYESLDRLSFNKEAVAKFMDRIGYSGLFSLEFIRDSEGKDFFLEINLRNDGNAYCVKTAGVNLPFIWCYYNWFKDLSDIHTTIDTPVYFMPDYNDIKVGIHSVGFIKWIYQFMSAKSHAVFNRKDISPFVFATWRFISSHLEHIRTKSYRKST